MVISRMAAPFDKIEFGHVLIRFQKMMKKQAFLGNGIKIFFAAGCFVLGCLVTSVSSQSTEIKDRIDYTQLKAEARLKYRLPPRVKDSTEESDTLKVLSQLGLLLRSKKIVDSNIVESAETKMNRRMDITNLEYAIDHLEDSVPKIREKKKLARKASLEKAKKESDGKIHPDPIRIQIW